MSLDGAHLNFVNAAGVSVAHAAKGRKFNVGSFLGCDLVLPDAERVHCEIQCDAFGRVTIYNYSRNEPILLNDQVVQATAKRPLLHGARIKILNEVYTWNFPKSDEVGTPDRALPEQAANSSPSLKVHRQRRQFDNRLTVHKFRYSINSDDEGNTSIESRELETSASSNSADNSATAEPERSITTPAKQTDETMPKVDLLEATQNKENTSTLGNKLMLQLCARSDVVITSFSPRETGVKIEKSFTCVMKPTAGIALSSAATTPKSVYNTPKSVLSELNDDSCSRDLPEFSTPSTSKKALAGKRPTSMYLVDLTTPQRLRPTLSFTPKQTPGSVEIISVDSADELSDASPIVIDITNSSTPSTTPAKKRQPTVLKTPKEQLLAVGSTPRRTPQSLMKRALLTSAKKQIPANSRTPKTPLEAPSRQSLLDTRRQCLTAPRRLPFHPQPQWRTPARRQIPALDVKAPQTSPRKRLSMSLSSPRENKISKLRKTLAANAKLSPTVGMSNKLVAKARRALNSPKQESPNRIGSPRVGTPNANQPENFDTSESTTPDREDRDKADLSRTFTIDDEHNATGPAFDALTALIDDEAATNESVSASKQQSKINEMDLKLSASSTKDSSGSSKDTESCGESSKISKGNEEVALNRTFDLIESPSISKSKLDLTADAEQLSNSKLANESIIIDKHCAADEEKVSDNDITAIHQEESDTNLATEAINKSLINAEAVDVIEDSICEEVPTTPTYQEDVVAITDVHLAEDTICEEVPTSGVDSSITNANADSEDQEEEEAVAPPGLTPIPRRSSRCFATTQNEVSLTPRRSVRRASIDAKIKLEQCIKPTRRASCSAVVESQPNTIVAATPKRKRRLTEELSTPTRKSQRLLCNTPKRPLQVDESVGDMGVIIEEDAVSADKFPTVMDEDYGNELPIKDTDEPDKIDYHGMRELLKTPKSCSTPHFKGLREMIRTPKVHPSPMLGNIEELLETPSNDASTPKRSVTVNRITLELTKSENTGDTQDMYFKTPRGRHLMIPNDPASAVLKTIDKSLATTTEYDLNATNPTLQLDKIFDDVLAVETTDPAIAVEDSENEINVTAISTAADSEPDPLSTSTIKAVEPSDTVRSEILMNICYAETSHKDPLTSTAFKKGAETDPNLSGLDDESYADKPNSPGICEVSGIQMLDQTTDSMFSEPLVVTRVDSFDVTLEETKPTGMAKMTKNEVLDEGSDTDSMVGLSEPLILSDDEAEEVKESSANDSIIPVDGANVDTDRMNIKRDTTESDAAKESSVKRKYLNEEESIDLTAEESQECELDTAQDASMKESKMQKNAEAASANTTCNQMESQIESEFAIELETTATDESVAQTEVTRTSTIYGADLSQTNESIATETKSTDESLIRDSSNIQDKGTNEIDSITQLDCSSAQPRDLDNENVVNDKNEGNDITISEEEMPGQLEAVQSQKEAELDTPRAEMSAEQSTEQSEIPNEDEAQPEVGGTIDSDADSELNASNGVQIAEVISKTTEESLMNATSQDNEDSVIDLNKTDLIGQGSEADVAIANFNELEVNMQASDEAETDQKADGTSPELSLEDESLVDAHSSAANSDLHQTVIEEDGAISLKNHSVLSIEPTSETNSGVSRIESQERKSQFVEEMPENGDAKAEVKALNENSQLTDETENESEVIAVDASNAANDKFDPEVITKSLDESLKSFKDDVAVTSESVNDMDASVATEEETEEIVLNQIELRNCTQVDPETTNSDESLVEMDASLVNVPEKEEKHLDKQFSKIVTISSGNPLNEPYDESKSEDVLEATTADDVLAEVVADETEEHLDEQTAETLSTSAEILTNLDGIGNKTEDNLECTNADESLVEMDASVEGESKNEEEHLDEQAAETLSTSEEISLNQDEMENKTHLVKDAAGVSETDKAEEHLDEQTAETLSTSAEIFTNLDEIGNKTEDNLECTNVDDSLVEMDASVEGEPKKEEEHLDEQAAETLSTSAEISSNQDEMENKTHVVKDAAGVSETDKAKEHTDTLSTSAEVPSNQDEIEKKTEHDLECTNADESLVEMDASVEADSKNKEELVPEMLAKSDMVKKSLGERLSDSEAQHDFDGAIDDDSLVELNASGALEMSSITAEKSPNAPVDVDVSLVELDVSVVAENERESEHLDVPETLLTSAKKDIASESSLIKLDASVVEAVPNQKEIDNKTEVHQESTTLDDSLLEQNASGDTTESTSAEKSLVNIQDSQKPNDVEHTDKASVIELEVNLSGIAAADADEPTIDENSEEMAKQQNETKEVTDVPEPLAQCLDTNSANDTVLEDSIQNKQDPNELDMGLEPEEEKTSGNEAAIDVDASCEAASTVEVEDKTSNDSLIDQQVSTESTTVDEVLDHAANTSPYQEAIDFEIKEQLKISSEAAVDQSGPSKPEEKSPEAPSMQIEDNEAVIDMRASCMVDLRSVEDNLKEESLSMETIEEQTTVLNAPTVGKAAVNDLDVSKETPQMERQDATNQLETSTSPVEEAKSTQIMETTIEIIDSKVEIMNPTMNADEIPSQQVESEEASDLKEKSTALPEEPTKKPDEMIIDLISSDDESSSHASVKVSLADKTSDVDKSDKVKSSTSNRTENQVTDERLVSETVTKANADESSIVSECPQTQNTFTAENMSAKSVELKPKKGRGRKPSTIEEFDSNLCEMTPSKRATRKASATVEPKETHNDEISERLNVLEEEKLDAEKVQLDVEETPKQSIKKVIEKQKLEKPKASRRKSMAEVTETMEDLKAASSHPDKEIPAEVQSEKSKRRVRKPTTETVETEAHMEKKLEQPIDLDKPKRRGQKPSVEVAEPEAQVEEEIEKTVDLKKPKGRGRKPSANVVETDPVSSAEVIKPEAHLEENREETFDLKKQKRQGRIHATENVATEARVEENVGKAMDLGKPKRRGRKPSEEVVQTETHMEEKVQQMDDSDKPKRRRRKPSAEVVERGTSLEEKTEQNLDLEKTKRRVRKPAIQVVETEAQVEEVEVEKPTRRDQKPAADIAETEAHIEEKSEETIEPKRHGRKPSADVANAEKNIEETIDLSKPKQRGEKVSVDVPVAKQQEDNEEPTPTEESSPKVIQVKPKRRYRKASAEVKEATESAELPERKTRNARQASTETVESEKTSKTHLDVIDEADEPEQKKLRLDLPADLDTGHKTKVRSRKQSASAEVLQTEEPLATPPQEIVVASSSRAKPATRRGRKATTDEEIPPVQQAAEAAELKPKRRGRKASADVAHAENQPLEPAEKSTRRARNPSADVEHKVVAEADPLVEKKTTRRVRNPSTNAEIEADETPQPKKTTARRGRKASVPAPTDDMLQQFDIQSLPVNPIEPVTIVSVTISPRPQVISSEDELTPRRREGRNLPRKNYDETSDEDKPGSRKARKPVATKVAAVAATPKLMETETSPHSKPSTPLPTKLKASVELAVEPVVEPNTPVITVVLPEPTSSQKREGRNMPRKNYSETSDDEKPSTSRGRRVRQPTIKALELLVDASSRPATPKRRAGKAKATETAENHTVEPPEKKIAVDESTPVPAKARGAPRRKALDVDEVTEAESVAPTPTKRGARSRKESATSQADEPDVEVEQKQPAKRNARGGNTRKAKIVADEAADEQPANKKARGGARAKTPVVIEVEKVHEVEESPEVPATKRAPPARGRAARAVKIADEAETVQETVQAPPSRTGRGRKVHFETTDEVAKDEQSVAVEAPKRATRSRRK